MNYEIEINTEKTIKKIQNFTFNKSNVKLKLKKKINKIGV